MNRHASTPGPEIGWAFGLVGFAATVFVGWLIGAGVGFVLFMVVFWVGVGSLFAFLVERSTIEENDRVDELQNTRLATLAPAWTPPSAPEHRWEGDRADEESRGAAHSGTPRRVRSAGRDDGRVLASPRAYREERMAGHRGLVADERVAEILRGDRSAPRPVAAERPDPSSSVVASRARGAAAVGATGPERRPTPAVAADRREPGRPDPARRTPDRRPTGSRPGASPEDRPAPRSPREYREARAEADRKDHAAA